MAIAVIVVLAVVTVVVAIVIVIAVAITITIIVTVVAGYCNCFQDNKSLTVFDISCAFYARKQVAVADAYTTVQKVMVWTNQRLGKLLPGSPEDLRFCGSFGVLAEVSVTAWDMMENHSVLPPTSKFLHFLWALAFICTYPANNTTLSSLLGGSNPKAISKYVWPFIRSIFALNKCLVS